MITALAHAGNMARGLMGMRGMVGAAGTVKGVAKAHAVGSAARTGLGTLGNKMAGRLANNLGEIGFGSNAAMTNTALMFGPDLAFGALAGAMTPGDIGDKAIAGTLTGLGGAIGGVGARGLIGGKNPAVQMGLELGGGLVGDMAGSGVADSLLRLKGGGSTPYEKMAADQQKELEQRILKQYLSGKGGYSTVDPTLASNGLVS